MSLSSSPHLNASLASIGILTPEDVLSHLPRRYESFAYTPRKDIYGDKERLVKKGFVEGHIKSLRFRSRSLSSFYFVSEGESFLVEAWNRPYLAKYLKEGEVYTIIGVYSKRRHCLALINLVKGTVAKEDSLRPVYSLPNGVPNHTFVSLVRRCLFLEQGHCPDVAPSYFARKYRLLSHYEALKKAHMPTSLEDIHDGLRVLKYEEALIFSLKNAIVRGDNRAIKKDKRRQIDREKLASFITSLPYKLTEDQKKVLAEGVADMDSPNVMYRLLQGDVGTGKTLVAALLAYSNHTRSEQTALMAPTDALARQHYETLKTLFEGTRIRISLLVGSLSPSDRASVLEDIADGTTDIVVGTHSLFSKGVSYAYLGLAIIDEQHKFGVNQRSLLLDKGDNADLLLMSATPIPRTLALTIYGDLDVSSLYLFPQGKRKVTTLIKEPDDPLIQDSIKASIASHHRVYIVVPQIEGNGDELTSVKAVYEEYRKRYPNQVSIMHGKMDEESKEVALAAFRSGLCPILVATSLIEVGIDVKEANLMVIYSPSHFALSSLHQLRGRIGRDGTPATCILAYGGEEAEEKEKLDILLKTDDGFKIAEEDMRLRGPGEMAGTKQSGLPSFNYANVIDDFKIFECARDDATYMLSHQDDPSFAPLIEKASKEASPLAYA